MLAGLVLLIPIAFLRGGRLSRLADVRISGGRYVLAGLAIQVVILETPIRDSAPSVLPIVHIASYMLIGLFFYKNRHLTGLVILGVGGASNFAAIVTNKGVMPATEWAARTAGLVEGAHKFANSAPSTHAPLWFLGDVFAIPHAWPLHNVFSIGDVVILIGAATFLYQATRPEPSELGATDTEAGADADADGRAADGPAAAA